jgi:hypothetical protein
VRSGLAYAAGMGELSCLCRNVSPNLTVLQGGLVCVAVCVLVDLCLSSTILCAGTVRSCG